MDREVDHASALYYLQEFTMDAEYIDSLRNEEFFCPLTKKHRPFIEWWIDERNKQWHDTYFSRVSNHQAKGNCRFAWHILEFMEREGWLQKNDIILDPMCGIGSFNIVAALKGYSSIGVELEKVFVDDMIGYDDAIISEDDLFPTYHTHIEGNIEHFKHITKGLRKVGNIVIVRGDARDLHSIVPGCFKYNTAVLCSPPYGNRLKDEGQQFGSNEGREDRETWKGLEDDLENSYNKQYSLDPRNIGNSKISVLSSPPYGRSTEHSSDQIEALPDETRRVGHKGFVYANPKNIAVLGDSAYEKQMQLVYNSLYKTLQQGAYVALITRDFIQKKKVVQLAQLTSNMMEKAGFSYITTRRAVLPELSFFKRINWNKHFKDIGLPMIIWEDATFYVKEK